MTKVTECRAGGKPLLSRCSTTGSTTNKPNDTISFCEPAPVGQVFTVTRYPVYNFPKRVYDLSPNTHKPILRLNDGRVLLHSVAFNAYFDETIQPGFFPENAFARAENRGLILVCGDLLTRMRMVYTANDDESLTKTIDKLFVGITNVAPQLQSVMARHGQPDAQMVEAAFAGFLRRCSPLNASNLTNHKPDENNR